MGGQQSSHTEPIVLFNEQEWRVSGQSNHSKIWTHRQNPTISMQEHQIQFASSAELGKAGNVYRLRNNDSQLVSGLHGKFINEDHMCSKSYSGKFYVIIGCFYTEYIPQRLRALKGLNFPNTLHAYDQAFKGYQKLYRQCGPFKVNQECIGVNNHNVIKVWHNQCFEDHEPHLRARSETETVRSILNTVEANTNTATAPAQEPSFSSFLLRGKDQVGFIEARRKLEEYANYFNRGLIPAQLGEIHRDPSHTPQLPPQQQFNTHEMIRSSSTPIVNEKFTGSPNLIAHLRDRTLTQYNQNSQSRDLKHSASPRTHPAHISLDPRIHINHPTRHFTYNRPRQSHPEFSTPAHKQLVPNFKPPLLQHQPELCRPRSVPRSQFPTPTIEQPPQNTVSQHTQQCIIAASLPLQSKVSEQQIRLVAIQQTHLQRDQHDRVNPIGATPVKQVQSRLQHRPSAASYHQSQQHSIQNQIVTPHIQSINLHNSSQTASQTGMLPSGQKFRQVPIITQNQQHRPKIMSIPSAQTQPSIANLHFNGYMHSSSQQNPIVGAGAAQVFQTQQVAIQSPSQGTDTQVKQVSAAHSLGNQNESSPAPDAGANQGQPVPLINFQTGTETPNTSSWGGFKRDEGNLSISSLGLSNLPNRPHHNPYISDKMFLEARQEESINNSTRNFYTNLVNNDTQSQVELGAQIGHASGNLNSGGTSKTLLEQLKTETSTGDNNYSKSYNAYGTYAYTDKYPAPSETSKLEKLTFIKEQSSGFSYGDQAVGSEYSRDSNTNYISGSSRDRNNYQIKITPSYGLPSKLSESASVSSYNTAKIAPQSNYQSSDSYMPTYQIMQSKLEENSRQSYERSENSPNTAAYNSVQSNGYGYAGDSYGGGADDYQVEWDPQILADLRSSSNYLSD